VIIPIQDFVIALLRSEHAGELVPGKFWDLSASNSCFLGFQNAFIDIDKCLFGNQILYVFRPWGLHPSRDTAWELALPDAASALECVWHQLGPHTVSLAEHLVERGVPFLTLSRTIVNPVLTSHGVPHNDISLGYCPTGYTPHLADYAVYQASLASFLHQPHARAALLKGGIIWHLAKEFLDNEAVLMGPSEHALHGILGMFTCNGTKFCDDQLTESEMDLISGVYKVYTGVASSWFSFLFDTFTITGSRTQTADCSWWPKQSVWELCGLNVGYWSSDCEVWFQSHLTSIHQGDAVLKSSREWRKCLALTKDAPRLARAMVKVADAYISGTTFS
jgi:hypothetical protein